MHTTHTTHTAILPRVVLATLMALTVIIAMLTAPAKYVRAQVLPLNCSTAYQIVHTFANGATWEMCWELRAGYGYRLNQVTFTPSGGPRRLILGQLHMAQLFIPYDDNSTRYHDLSYGRNLIGLTSDECPNGTLLTNATLCRTTRPRGFAYRSGAQSVQSESMALYGYMSIGNYYYIIQYVFNDDGSLEPTLGASGMLQRYGGDTSTGWPVRGQIGVNHNHLVIWRMDFDLDGAANDVVEQVDFAGNGTDARTRLMTPLTTEAKAQNDLNGLRFWRVRDAQWANTDGHSLSYEIEPIVTDLYRAGEAFTQNDFYVTNFNGNELTADDGAGLDSFVNGEAVSDVVAWYAVNFHHVPRDEDDARMPAHWQGFVIRPRDMQAASPWPDNGPPPTSAPTPLPTATAMATLTPMPTSTAPPAATPTPLPTATAIATLTPMPTSLPTATATALPTPTRTPTRTPVPPTATAPPISTSGCNAYEPNDTLAQVRPINVGETQAHVFCVANDKDYTVAYLNAGQTYTIDTLNLAGKTNTLLWLYNSAGNQLAYDDDGGSAKHASLIRYTPVASGNFYILVTQKDGKGSKDHRYSLRVR